MFQVNQWQIRKELWSFRMKCSMLKVAENKMLHFLTKQERYKLKFRKSVLNIYFFFNALQFPLPLPAMTQGFLRMGAGVVTAKRQATPSSSSVIQDMLCKGRPKSLVCRLRTDFSGSQTLPPAQVWASIHLSIELASLPSFIAKLLYPKGLSPTWFEEVCSRVHRSQPSHRATV